MTRIWVMKILGNVEIKRFILFLFGEIVEYI